MHHWGIKTKMRIAILAPIVLVIIALAVGFYMQRYQELEVALKTHGTALLRQLIPNTEYGLLTNNRHLLQGILNASVANPDIRGIALFDEFRQPVAMRGEKIVKLTPEILAEASADEMTIQKLDTHSLSFIVPIYIPQINVYADDHLLATDGDKASNHQKLLGYISLTLDVNHTQLKEYQALLITVLFALFGILLGVALTEIVVRHIATPVSQLAAKVNQYMRGKKDINIEVDGEGEIANLQQNVKDMFRRLHKMQANMQESIDEATSDLKQNLEALEIKNVELNLASKQNVERSRIKSEFIANMSHEIRTPINGIVGFTKLLLETDLTAAQRDYLSTIQKSSTSLLSIINDILDFSKIEAGKLQLDSIPMDIRDCIEEVLTILAPEAHKKNLELIPLIASDVPVKVLGDPLRIKQIITNLVSNAIKFTQQGSISVTVSLQKDEGESVMLHAAVTDTGIGISKEEQKHLFSAFSQADISTTRRFGGTGLGLVISKRLIQQMGGEIGINSEPGDGATFQFTFKASKIMSLSGAVIEHKRLANMKFIVYDQHPSMGLSLKHNLQLWRADYTLSEDRESFLTALQDSDKVNCVIIGVNQFNPGLARNRYLLSEARKYYGGPILMLINTTDQAIHKSILEQNVDLVLCKPIGHLKLYRSLCSLLIDNDSVASDALVENKADVSRKKSHASYLRNKSILVVDDNPANAMLFSAMLERAEATVTVAEDGEAATALTDQKRFDAILLDLQMPRMNGIEACKIMRSEQVLNSDTPIIAVSAYIKKEEREALHEAGADAALTKPVDEQVLRDELIRLMSRQKTTPAKQVATVSVIDWQESLKLAANKQNLAEDMLNALLEELPTARAKIHERYMAKDWLKMREEVHRLHGGCCYVGVPQLKGACKQLESSIETGKGEELAEMYAKFEQAVTALLKVREAGLSEYIK